MDKILDLELESLHHGLLSSEKFYKKPIVVFNSASHCEFTKQLTQFQKLHKEGNIVPIALPTNEFGEQEPGDNYEICQYANIVYKVSFTVCLKTNLDHKLFKRFGKPTWNFNKYVFDSDHNFVKRLDSEIEPRKVLEYV